MPEKERIQLLHIISLDTNKIEIKLVTDIFLGTFINYFEKTKSGKEVKQKLTDDEFKRLINGVSISFLSSLYLSASDSKEQFEARLKIVDKANKDILVSKETLN